MVELVVVGIVAGFLAGISPCILPVLPVVLVAGASSPIGGGLPAGTGTSASGGTAAGGGMAAGAGLGRSLAVIGGLVLSFSIIVLAGSEILSLLHLPQDALRDAGIALLAVVGLGYLIPPLGDLLERPFARVGTRRPSGRAGASCSAWRSAWSTSRAPGRCWRRRAHRDRRARGAAARH